MIYRDTHENNYSVISNRILKDGRLSLGACGLLCRLLSFPDEWEFSIEGISSSLSVSKKVIHRLLKELKEAGYIEIEKVRDKTGHFGAVIWHIRETPSEVPKTEVRKRESRNTEIPFTEVPQNRSSEKGTIIKYYIESSTNSMEEKIEKEKTPFGEFQNVFLSPDEEKKLKDLFGEDGFERWVGSLGDYLKEHPRKKYASHYRTILKWSEKERKGKEEKKSEDLDWNEILRLAEQRGETG